MSPWQEITQTQSSPPPCKLAREIISVHNTQVLSLYTDRCIGSFLERKVSETRLSPCTKNSVVTVHYGQFSKNFVQSTSMVSLVYKSMVVFILLPGEELLRSMKI